MSIKIFFFLTYLGHRNIIQILQQKKQERIETEFKEIQDAEEKIDEGVLAVTARMMRTVFTEVKNNVPLASHPEIVNLQKANNVDLGIHHFDRQSATRMMEFISAEMHRRLIDHLLSKNSPVSIILDGSTDVSFRHFLIVYFQAMEDNVPIVYFYKLVETADDETAAGYFNSLKRSFIEEERDLYGYLKSNLIGFASDGASVMMGRNHGLITFFQSYVDNPIYSVHCMAHRLQLAITRCFNTFEYFKEFESVINNVTRFYSGNGYKRRSHLRALSVELNEAIYEMNYIYKARWISSELKVLNNIQKMWHLLVTDLLDISKDEENFSLEARLVAEYLNTYLRGKNFLLLFHFLTDVLEHLSRWSRQMQQRTGLLIDFADFSEKVKNSFEILKTKNGKNLVAFLHNCLCPTQACETTDKYDDTPQVFFNRVELIQDHRTFAVPWLVNIRDEFLSSLIDEVESYFPSGQLKNFDIFKPSNLPSKEEETFTYGTSEVYSICNFFQWNDCKGLQDDWIALLQSMMKSDRYCDGKNKESSSYAFWAQFSKSDIAWTEKTRQLINTILVLPIGSADAERGFSIMNHIKTSRRTRLTSSHLNDIMRIRINGIDEVNKWPAARHARQWVKAGKYRTDDTRKIKKPRLDQTTDYKKIFLPKSNNVQ